MYKPYQALSLGVEPFVAELKPSWCYRGDREQRSHLLRHLQHLSRSSRKTWRRSAKRLIVIQLKWLMGAIVLVNAA